MSDYFDDGAMPAAPPYENQRVRVATYDADGRIRQVTTCSFKVAHLQRRVGEFALIVADDVDDVSWFIDLTGPSPVPVYKDFQE